MSDNPGNRKQETLERFDGYYRGEEHVWGTEPSEGVVAALPFLVAGRVLDLGAGDGRNTLYLAAQGHHVTAVDLAPTAIANLARYADEANLQGNVKGVVADIAAYQIAEQFENVITTFTLHFLQKEEFFGTLDKIAAATTTGGVNVIEDFTRDGPLYDANKGGYWPEKDELQRYYQAQGWKVTHYEERVTSTKATDEQGNHYLQGAFTLVATNGGA